ncbi:protocadherin alpha-3-like [Halichoeres trimaculatus]|uniref:protocadherin alpha-3-like n=1 Tax=Halichoeres trimaculatus TaxID=147232 RepID=UPI003D9F51E4
MGIETNGRTMGSDCLAFYLSLLMLFGTQASAQIRYSVPEEVKQGTVVGNVAKDLGLDIATLTDRRFRVVSGSKEAIFEVNQNNGALYVHSHIDREELCQGSGTCLMELKILVENPLEIHYVIVEITDVNDHAPIFPEKEQSFEIAEHTLPGRRFQLETARDPDAGVNSIRTYTLTSNEHFEVDIRQSDEEKIPFLVLKKSLDREQKDKHTLLLTAVDGGKPQRSGTLNVTIIVLDTNDNRPMFSQEVYQIEIQENVPPNTLVLKINASDPDEGSNGEVIYSFGKSLRRKGNNIFELDKSTGEIRVKGLVDFEENDVHKLDIEASDKASPPLTGECRVIIKIKDINDNPPEIEVTSLSNTVPEDSKPGTIVSLLSVSDKDSGVNGKIILQISNNVPFELKPSYKENTYSVVTKGTLDREQVSHYEITIKATDCGDPPLSTFKTLSIQISDVNDNSPHFEQNPLHFYLVENNVAGEAIFSVRATDNDVSENAAITYHIVREGSQNDVTSFLNVNSENGHITALKSFDFETVKTFQFHVVASDSGSPQLSSNVTVNVFILDQNDNAPVILYPLSSNGSAEGVEEIPRNANAGQVVTKVRAYDADIGYNGWLLFSLHEVTEHSLFALDRYTGQIRTLRSFTETDEAEHKLLILVKDNGNVSLSATATVIVKVVEPKEAFAASDVKSATNHDEESNVTFYLMITLASVSALFIISIIVLIAMQCSKSTDYTSKYLQETNYDGTLCHSIQYRSGDKRYMLVGPRMSIGSTIVPGSHANTLVLPDRRRPSTEGSQNDVTSFLNVNSENGHITALKSFDFETVKTFQFHVVASDSGSPQLSSNVTVNVFILDQNDNAPVILYPLSSNGSAEGVEEIPRNANAGQVVTKVRAYDADIGYNGWLLFSLQEVTEHSLFALDRYTGQIRTLRSFTETDEAEHKLLILVKDNGNVSLSATATVIVKVVEPKEAFAASDVKSATNHDEESNVTFYLMITLASVSALFIISIIVLIAMQCSKSTDYTSKYLQETNYDGTLCHSIQYRSGDKRYMLVGPRMSIGSTIVPGSHANTLVLPDRRRASTEVRAYET